MGSDGDGGVVPAAPSSTTSFDISPPSQDKESASGSRGETRTSHSRRNRAHHSHHKHHAEPGHLSDGDASSTSVSSITGVLQPDSKTPDNTVFSHGRLVNLEQAESNSLDNGFKASTASTAFTGGSVPSSALHRVNTYPMPVPSTSQISPVIAAAAVPDVSQLTPVLSVEPTTPVASPALARTTGSITPILPVQQGVTSLPAVHMPNSASAAQPVKSQSWVWTGENNKPKPHFPLHSTIGARPPRASHVAQKEQLPAVATEITKLHSPWADTRISERSIYVVPERTRCEEWAALGVEILQPVVELTGFRLFVVEQWYHNYIMLLTR